MRKTTTKCRCCVDSLGTGLANLRERYRLLTQHTIEVTDTAAAFVVTVPLVAAVRPLVAAHLPAAVPA